MSAKWRLKWIIRIAKQWPLESYCDSGKYYCWCTSNSNHAAKNGPAHTSKFIAWVCSVRHAFKYAHIVAAQNDWT